MHTTCWCRIINLLADEVRGEMKVADRCIAEMKFAFTKSIDRQQSYLEHLTKAGLKTCTLPPPPVLTRWTTWLRAGSHHWNLFAPTVTWIQSSTENTRVMKSLKEIIGEDLEQLAQELERISKVYEGVASTIRNLERDNMEASEVWPQLQLLKSYMVTLGLSPGKSELYMDKKHPAISFWNEVQVLDIRKCPAEFSCLPASLQRFSTKDIPAAEIVYFNYLRRQENVKSALTSKNKAIEFWTSHKAELPSFSELALKALSVLPSRSCVERSFSYLKKTLAPQRTAMTEDNLSAHLRVIFNKKKGGR